MANHSEFYRVVSEAINDLMEHGFDSQQRLDTWLSRIAEAARQALVPETTLRRTLVDVLGLVYKRTEAKLMKVHPGISQFTLQSIKPKLRAELDRRILASASLIKLNREASIARTLQRFAGWASSVPAGGTEVAQRKEVKDTVRRGIAGLPFEERRVIEDQGHRLVAAINEIVAVDGGAIAGLWRHVMERGGGYTPRPSHVARNGRIYLLRDSWAHKAGYVKPIDGYTDQITQPAEEISCRCQYVWKYTLGSLPTEMLTAKGKASLLEVRNRMQSLGK